MNQELIGHGAEAKIFKVKKEDLTLAVKQRFAKKYRHPELDKKINESRIRSEVKIMKKLLQKGVAVPLLHKVDESNYTIDMIFVEGKKLKDYINDPSLQEGQLKHILYNIGRLVYQVHQVGIIHGDLTTSNMIISDSKVITLIDFGLSYFKESAQDRAVDLYVLERAFKSTHPQLENHFSQFFVTYSDQSVLKKLQVVRQRGRKKVAFG